MKLYKYTTINKNLFDMLNNQYFYCSDIKKFDDLFDARMPFDLSVRKEQITNKYVEEVLQSELPYFVAKKGKNDFSIIDNLLSKEIIDSIDFSNEDNFIYDNESQKNEEISNRVFNILSNKQVILYFKKLFKTLISIQTEIKVCCFSAEKDNPILWSMYGDHFKGCCIEYDVSESLIKQVNYIKRYELDPLYMIINGALINKTYKKIKIDKNKVKKMLLELMYSKDELWKFQNEYRVITRESKVKCTINNIYLGYKISKKNENKILNYLGNFKIKKMKIDYINQTFKFDEYIQNRKEI